MAKPCTVESPCSHSIGTRLSNKLAIFTMLVLGALFASSWFATSHLIQTRNAQDLDQRCALVEDVLKQEANHGGLTAVLDRLRSDAPMRGSNRIEIWTQGGKMLHADAPFSTKVSAAHRKSAEFQVAALTLPDGKLFGRYTVDYSDDNAMGQRWALILVGLTLAAGAVVAAGVRWRVRRELIPLMDLAAQTRAISPQELNRRLDLNDPAEELLPWIEQFNALMQRLEQSYTQLEGFNADVAHELRTPLANVIGQTEVILSRERPLDELRDTLASNLEEMQRLSALVNDMLFLSQADRGAVARRGAPVSLASLAHQVVEFHEGPLEDAGLSLRVEGDVELAVDESLFKRALSNLVGNATRFANRGSAVVVAIAALPDRQVRVEVCNEGQAIEAHAVPRLFDRFFRADDGSRNCGAEVQHHGLGLAIVAAIARMHAGRTVAESADGTTRVGFTLAPG